MYEHPFFKTKPAIAAFKNISDPKPDQLRACILELCRHIIKQDERITELESMVSTSLMASQSRGN